jgi:ATP-binding cassette subfamily F protein 2
MMLPRLLSFSMLIAHCADDTTQEVRGLNDGEAELFEKKLSKEEKKARAKAAREAKRSSKKPDGENNDETNETNLLETSALVLQQAKEQLASLNHKSSLSNVDDGLNHEASDALASAGTICTFASSAGGLVDPRSRDICVRNVTLQHCGAVLLHETDIVLNHGNRYGLIGRNGCGKVSKRLVGDSC